MIVYNVTVKVEQAAAAEWLDWMKQEHIPDLMATGLFTGHSLYHLLEQDESDGVTYTVQYFCNSLAEYDTYISTHAPAMRNKAFRRFGNRFIAFRSLMEMES